MIFHFKVGSKSLKAAKSSVFEVFRQPCQGFGRRLAIRAARFWPEADLLVKAMVGEATRPT
jgi:hypothetical protein